jgi:hypothetical protein
MLRRIGRALSATMIATVLFTGGALAQDDASVRIADGGVFVDGWTGRIDAQEARNGMRLEDARLARRGEDLHVRTGPAVTYWNPANRLTGNYTVTATFTEHEYMALNNHPHPYGIVIAGNELGTEQQTYLYCSAYGNGNFIVRGFGPEPFQMNGRRGEAHDAVNRAAGQGQPVTQQISMSVRDGQVSCAINGTVVASYPVSEVVKSGQLSSTDGIWGLRFGHNTEATVSGVSVTRH